MTTTPETERGSGHGPVTRKTPLEAFSRLLESTKTHANRSRASHTANNVVQHSDEELERQRNLSRVLLKSNTAVESDVEAPAEVQEATDAACRERWKKTRDQCLRERITNLRAVCGDGPDAEPEKLRAAAMRWISAELARPAETLSQRSLRVMQKPFNELCASLAARNAGKSKTAVMKLAIKTLERAEALRALDEPKDDERLEVRFKRWLEVNPGAAQQQIEDRLSAKNPRADPINVRTQARAELRKLVSKKTSKWAQFFLDDKMTQMLCRYQDMGDESARAILEAFLDYKVRIESTTERERENREHDVFAQRQSRTESLQEAKRVPKSIAILVKKGNGRVPHGDGEFMPPDALRDPPIEAVETREDSLTGAVVKISPTGEPVERGVSTAAQFLNAYTREKSDSDDSAHQRLAERIARGVEEAIMLHIKFLQIASPSALFASTGRADTTPRGNTVEDLLALLESSDAVPQLDGNSVVRYLAEWQRCLVESRIDIDNAVAARHRQYDADLVKQLVAELGVESSVVEANFAFGVDPETSAVMKQVMWAADNDWFRHTDAQADQRYKHSERVERIERRAKRRRAAAAKDDAQSSNAAGESHSHSQSRTREQIEMSDDEAAQNADPEDTLNVEAQFSHMVLHSRAARRMPIIDFDYFPQFMRKGLGEELGERDCRNGESCYCAVKSANYPYVEDAKRRGRGFVCREFLLPSELDQWRVRHELPQRRSFCVFCEMFMITIEFDRLVKERVTPVKILHRWAVRIGPGQFNADCMLPVRHEDRWSGIVRPFPRMSASHYVFGKTEVGDIPLPCMRPTDRLDFRLTSSKRMRI